MDVEIKIDNTWRSFRATQVIWGRREAESFLSA
jgi:hypothetical protein